MFRLLRVRNLLGAGAVLFAMGAAFNALHTTQGLHGAIHDSPLAAADYRAPIVEVEALLFAPAPLSMEDRVRLAHAIDQMRRELEQRGGTDLAKFSARELGTLAGMSRGLGNLEGANLERVRTNWMRIRSNTFDDAAWFRFSEADPVAAREEARVALSDADRTALARLREALRRIEAAIDRGTRDCERLGEAQGEWDASEGEAFTQSWRDWGESWRMELEGIQGWMPDAPGPAASPALKFAHTGAADALQQLAAIPGDGRGRWNAPYRVDWERRFQNAAKKVRDARFWIDRAGKGLGV